MAYKCPRCGKPVHRGYSGTAQMTAGLVGAFFYAAFGAFQCEKCGELSRGEFPEEDRRKILLGSIGLVLGAIAVAVFVLWLIAD